MQSFWDLILVLFFSASLIVTTIYFVVISSWNRFKFSHIVHNPLFKSVPTCTYQPFFLVFNNSQKHLLVVASVRYSWANLSHPVRLPAGPSHLATLPVGILSRLISVTQFFFHLEIISSFNTTLTCPLGKTEMEFYSESVSNGALYAVILFHFEIFLIFHTTLTSPLKKSEISSL